MRSLILMMWVVAVSPAAVARPQPMPEQASSATAMQNFARMRCSLDSDEHVVTWWQGKILADLPDAAPKPILGFEGFNICRLLPTEEGGWQFVSREVTYYSDLATGEIIESWNNPYIGEEVRVVQVANDPVSHIYPSPQQRDYSRWGWTEVEGSVLLTLDIPLDYPNALPPQLYPQESSGERYHASEHFMFFANRAELDDTARHSVPLSYGWARTGPWLPWMRMGQRAGGLIYSGQGKKLIGGFDALPERVRQYTLKHFPDYQRAPDGYYQPNETSWTYYRKLREAEAAQDEAPQEHP